MSAPRGRAKPPRHLADLDEPGRKALLEEMGLPGFRAKQLSDALLRAGWSTTRPR